MKGPVTGLCAPSQSSRRRRQCQAPQGVLWYRGEAAWARSVVTGLLRSSTRLALDILKETFMSRVEQLEGQVKDLRPEELAAFREWFTAWDAEVWDRQFEADAIAGKLDGMADRALRDHTAGRSTKL